jgi:hypothetical protein
LKSTLKKQLISKKKLAPSGEANPGEAKITKVMSKISSNSSRNGNL